MPSTASASAPAPAAAGSCARGGELVPGRERHQRREIDARLAEPRDEGLQPRAPLGERTLAQVLVAIDQQIVGAQMRGKLGQQLGVDGLAVEPLLQHVEALHAAVAHDQQFAVDRAGQPQRVDQVREAARNVLAGARIEPRDERAVLVRARRPPARGCRPISIRAMKSFGSSAREIALLDRVREHRGPERRRIAAGRLVGAAFEPGEQFGIGRLQPRPDQLDLLRVLVAERRGGGLGEPRGDADAQARRSRA